MEILNRILSKFLIITTIFLVSKPVAFGENRGTEYYAGKIKTHLEKAQSFTYKSNDSLRYYSGLALKAGEESGRPVLKRDAAYEIGYMFSRIGMLDTALVLLQEAKRLSVELQDSNEVGKAINRMGFIYWTQSEHLKAREAYKEAIKIHQKYEDKREIGRALNNLANLYRRWGDYEQAIGLYLKALDHYIDTEYKEGVAWLQFSMSLLYKRVGEPKEALETVKNSLKMYKQLAAENGDSSGIKICYSQMGFLYTHHFDSLEKGLEYQLKALRLSRKINIKPVTADGLTGVGQTYYKMGKLDQARPYLEEAYRLRIESEILSGAASNLKFLGYIQLEKKNYDEALEYFRESIVLSRKENNSNNRSDLYRTLSRFYAETDNPEKSLEYLKKHIALKDSILSTEIAKKIASTQLKYEVEKKSRENDFLVQQNKIQELKIAGVGIIRNLLIVIIAIFVLIITGVVVLYRKQKQVKTLKGLVPICANCKKIRNDEGYYEQVEKYISHHTGVNFSQGLCPDCMKKEQPEFYKKKKNQDKI